MLCFQIKKNKASGKISDNFEKLRSFLKIRGVSIKNFLVIVCTQAMINESFYREITSIIYIIVNFHALFNNLIIQKCDFFRHISIAIMDLKRPQSFFLSSI